MDRVKAKADSVKKNKELYLLKEQNKHIGNLKMYQQTSYKLPMPIEELQSYLEGIEDDDVDPYKLSLQCEPKE